MSRSCRHLARRAAASGPPAPGRHRAALPRSAVSVYGTGTSGSGAGPGSGARPPPRRPTPGRELAGEVDVPGVQALGQGEGDERRPAVPMTNIGTGSGTARTPPRAGHRPAAHRCAAGRGGPSRRVLVLRRRADGSPRGSPHPGGLQRVRLPGGALVVPSPEQREASTYGVAVMPSNSTAVNGDPGTGDGSTGCTCAAILTLTVALPRVWVGVDHLDHPQRQPGVLVGLLDYPLRGGPVEVPHHLESPGRVRAVREHLPELAPGSDLAVPSAAPRDSPLLAGPAGWYFSTRLEKISLV